MPTSRISAVYVKVELQFLDDDGDESGRGFVSDGKQPIEVPIYRAQLKKIQGLEEILADKGVKVV